MIYVTRFCFIHNFIIVLYHQGFFSVRSESLFRNLQFSLYFHPAISLGRVYTVDQRVHFIRELAYFATGGNWSDLLFIKALDFGDIISIESAASGRLGNGKSETVFRD